VDEAEMTVLNLLLAAHEEIVAAPATTQQASTCIAYPGADLPYALRFDL
jgi:hypothetical protein